MAVIIECDKCGSRDTIPANKVSVENAVFAANYGIDDEKIICQECAERDENA